MVEVVRDARESSSLLENTIPHGGHGTGGTGHGAGDGARDTEGSRMTTLARGGSLVILC